MTSITYFPIRGRVECSRLILEHVGATYEDKRISFQEWGELKVTLPYGQLPYYQDDEVSIPQSQAMVRHLGRKYSKWRE